MVTVCQLIKYRLARVIKTVKAILRTSTHPITTYRTLSRHNKITTYGEANVLKPFLTYTAADGGVATVVCRAAEQCRRSVKTLLLFFSEQWLNILHFSANYEPLQQSEGLFLR